MLKPRCPNWLFIRCFESWTATWSELFSCLHCLLTATFMLWSFFSIVETVSLKIWERQLPWHTKCSVLVAVLCSRMQLSWTLCSFDCLTFLIFKIRLPWTPTTLSFFKYICHSFQDISEQKLCICCNFNVEEFEWLEIGVTQAFVYYGILLL